MYEWDDIETKTEAEFILNTLKEKIKSSKIVRIFSKDDGIPEKQNNKIIYSFLEYPLYILFDNGYCLIISFIYYSSLYIKYKKLKPEELKKYISNVNKQNIDYFNNHHEIYGWDFDENGHRLEDSFRIKHIVDIHGKYDEILKFQVNGFHTEYDKWISNGNTSSIITIPAGGDYFNSITIILKKGVEITICPQPAQDDGYYDLIIKDKNNLINYKEINL